MTTDQASYSLIEGRPVLIVVDIQGEPDAPGAPADDTPPAIPAMPGYDQRMEGVPALIETARANDVPVIFFQEAHRRNLVDFGRELDGVESVHLLEGDPGTEYWSGLGITDDDYLIRKRRYSCFFGTELEILLKGLKADTLLLVGGHTDVCVHYTFVDAHQHDYFCRVIADCVAGSSFEAHEASLKAMEYLQTGAVTNAAAVTTAIKELS